MITLEGDILLLHYIFQNVDADNLKTIKYTISFFFESLIGFLIKGKKIKKKKIAGQLSDRSDAIMNVIFRREFRGFKSFFD